MTISFNLPKKQIPSEANLRRIIQILTGLMASQSTIESQCLLPYDETKTYAKGQICLYENQLYLCKTTTTGNFDNSKWIVQENSFDELTLDQVKALISLTDQELKTMTQLISDSEVRLDKTYSSSKIYTDIQDAISSCKQYVLIELAKKSTGSFKKANDVSEITDENYFYLIYNNDTSKYDIYALLNNNVEKLTTVDVNLDDYLTKTDAENTYLKKTDADGKYATITTVDGKVNKTSIVTSIDNTSTNDTVPTTKSVYDSAVKNKNLKTYTDLSQLGLTAPSTVGEIFNALPDRSLLLLECTDTDFNITDVPGSYGLLTIDKINNGRFSIMYKTSLTKSLAANNFFVGNLKGEDGTELTWKRVCITSVSDKPKTNIAPADTTKFVGFKGNSMCNYCVQNGICYVSLWGVRVTVTGRVNTGVILPMPKSGFFGGGYLTGGGDAITHAYAHTIPETGELKFNVKDANTALYGMFSYPVAES